MSKIRSMDEANVRAKRVLVRCDLNVPLKDGEVSDSTRLTRVAPTLSRLAARGARVVVLSHFGRPKGRDSENSLRRLIIPLSHCLNQKVEFASDCIGIEAEQAIERLPNGGVLLLENLRFHSGEELNETKFCDSLAALGEIFVNDAFSAAHRAHASTVGLASRLPAYAGPLMLEELEALRRAVDSPEPPVAAIVGGSKISSKIKVLSHLITRVNFLIIGGAMANSFLHAQGFRMGRSLIEPDLADTAREILEAAEQLGCQIILPSDVVVAEKLEAGQSTRTVAVNLVPERKMALDIGPESVETITNALEKSRTLLWNGPVGAFETVPFDHATTEIAKFVARLVRRDQLVAVAGGGDTVAALNQAGVTQDMTYVSTAGGAFLEYLEGTDLPGVAALHR